MARKRYTEDERTRIIDVFLTAIAGGWSIKRFCRVTGVRKSTLLTWCASDQFFDRYRRAVEVKNLSLPDLCDEVIKALRDAKSPEVDAKTAGVILRHYEFRLMREYKGGVFNPTIRQIDERRGLSDASTADLQREALEIEKEIANRALAKSQEKTLQ